MCTMFGSLLFMKALTFYACLAAGVASLAGVAALADDRQAEYNCDGATVVVVPGDTLWQIASTHCTGDISTAVYDLSQDYSATLLVGDTLYLP